MLDRLRRGLVSCPERPLGPGVEAHSAMAGQTPVPCCARSCAGGFPAGLSIAKPGGCLQMRLCDGSCRVVGMVGTREEWNAASSTHTPLSRPHRVCDHQADPIHLLGISMDNNK